MDGGFSLWNRANGFWPKEELTFKLALEKSLGLCQAVDRICGKKSNAFAKHAMWSF